MNLFDLMFGTIDLPIEWRLAHRRKLVEGRKNYTMVGRMHTIVFDAGGMDQPPVDQGGRPIQVMERNKLQWLDRTRLPMLAVSDDEQDLLIVNTVPHPEPLVNQEILEPTGLENMLRRRHPDRSGPIVDELRANIEWDASFGKMVNRDPAWVRRYPDGRLHPMSFTRPTRWPQRYRDRSCTRLKNSNFVLIQPVAQILFHPVRVAEWNLVVPRLDRKGRRMAFLIDPYTGEGHFIGGEFFVDSRIRMGEYAA